MKAISIHTLATALALAVAATLPWQAKAGGELVKFPENYAEGVLYVIVERGNLREEIFTSRAAIEAVKNGQPIPSGTVITLVDYRNGKLFRYVVMEKRTGWGAEYPPEKRNGESEYQAFRADKSVNDKEDLNRCFSCHKSRERQDFVWTFDQMKSAKAVGCVLKRTATMLEEVSNPSRCVDRVWKLTSGGAGRPFVPKPRDSPRLRLAGWSGYCPTGSRSRCEGPRGARRVARVEPILLGHGPLPNLPRKDARSCAAPSRSPRRRP